jgi:hypothetical protein
MTPLSVLRHFRFTSQLYIHRLFSIQALTPKRKPNPALSVKKQTAAQGFRPAHRTDTEKRVREWGLDIACLPGRVNQKRNGMITNRNEDRHEKNSAACTSRCQGGGTRGPRTRRCPQSARAKPEGARGCCVPSWCCAQLLAGLAAGSLLPAAIRVTPPVSHRGKRAVSRTYTLTTVRSTAKRRSSLSPRR